MPQTSVVMVTMHENPDYLFEAVKAGAAGYVLEGRLGGEAVGGGEEDVGGGVTVEPGACDEAPRKARQGGATEGLEADEPAAPERVASRPEANHPGQGGGDRQLESLTPREVEVLRLLSQGQTNPQIARNLLFSVSTVKAHVRSILNKLGVSDRTQAAVRAIEFRLTTD